ncbi:MAG: recombinase family protein [Candidatus Uhrbacteria bacterium]|nr:recombinase family protein [Candidatus Uhrbacteria bacterium]
MNALNQTRKYFIYTRKSTDTEDRQVRSIADQLAELRELAKKEQLEVVDVFVEKQTAKIPGRPIFNDMIARIEVGEASGILAWHPDRLARNSVDGGKIIYLVDTEKILGLKFPTFWFDPTPHGKFMLSIAFSQSKYYIDNLSENIKRGHRNKVKDGIWPQMAPLGYVNVKGAGIVVNKEMATLIRKTFEAYATGNFTLRQLRDKFNALGLATRTGRTLAVSNYQKILKNPIYTGLMKFNGEIHEGKHEPIITKKLFDTCQEVMTRKSKPKGPTLKPYIYRGLFRCGECGCFITTETQKGYNYLRCTKRKVPCSQKYVREDAITSQIREEIKEISLPSAWAEQCITELEKEKAETVQAESSFAQKTRDELALCSEKLDKLLDLHLNGEISQDEYAKKKQKLILAKKDYEEKLNAFEQKSPKRFERMIAFIKEANHAETIALHKNPVAGRDFLKKMSSNPRIAGMRLGLEIKNPWNLTADFNSSRQRRDTIFSQNSDFNFLRRGGDSNS